MNNPIYTSPLKDHLQNYVDLKQAMGDKFVHDARNLKRFDIFILEKYPEVTGLTKEIVLEWCSKKTCETEATRYRRAALIRKFGVYLESIGVKSYNLPKKYYSEGNQYTPYIYTIAELEKFFAEVDNDKRPCSYACPYRRQIMPVIFRMFYICGLRLSEAKLLKIADVDLEDGILTINQSKNDNSRLVPMPDSLTERCRAFSKEVHLLSGAEDYYFPALDGDLATSSLNWKESPMMKPTDFAKYLTDFLATYLPHQKNVSKNTIHSYRDTFKLLLRYYQDVKGLPVQKLTLEALDSQWVTDFLEWLEGTRKCSISTRNQRLAAIHYFLDTSKQKNLLVFSISKKSLLFLLKSKENSGGLSDPGGRKIASGTT